MKALGALERVKVRDVWEHEAADFTPWLAEKISLLAETIGLDELEVEAQEKNVGPFRADILCKETVSGAWVLIENQLERTDHAHLGQLITYAAGLEAVTIVWIAERFEEQHRKALDWLNEIAGDRLKCFGLEVELWRIGNSLPAPKFNVVCQPNDWATSVASNAGKLVTADLTETKRLQHEFWTAFAKVLIDGKSKVRPQKPSPQHWANYALGRSGIYLTAIASVTTTSMSGEKGEVGANITIDHPAHAKAFFAQLEAQKQVIEDEMGCSLNWYNPETKRMCTIGLRQSANIRSKPDWPSQHEWLRAKLERLQAVFGPRAKALVAMGANEEQ